MSPLQQLLQSIQPGMAQAPAQTPLQAAIGTRGGDPNGPMGALFAARNNYGPGMRDDLRPFFTGPQPGLGVLNQPFNPGTPMGPIGNMLQGVQPQNTGQPPIPFGGMTSNMGGNMAGIGSLMQSLNPGATVPQTAASSQMIPQPLGMQAGGLQGFMAGLTQAVPKVTGQMPQQKLSQQQLSQAGNAAAQAMGGGALF